MNNPDELPNYFYRDDALQLWYAIEAFVKSILSVFYKNNQVITMFNIYFYFWIEKTFLIRVESQKSSARKRTRSESEMSKQKLIASAVHFS